MRTYQFTIIVLLLFTGLGETLGQQKVIEETFPCTWKWDANSESDLAGYRFYIGTGPRVYDLPQSPIDVGDGTNITCAEIGVLGVGNYFAAVTAYDLTNNESLFSDEVQLQIIENQPPPKPVLSVVDVADVPDVPIDVAVSNLQISTGKPYNVSSAFVGNTVYIDRTYILTSVPEYLVGSIYIQTANNDKNVIDGDDVSHVKFNLNKSATVYVAFDSRVGVLNIPDWLKTFDLVAEGIETSDATFNLYSTSAGPTDYSANGLVVLGGNEVGFSHYLIFIK